MSLVGQWEEAKFPAGINLVQTMAPGWRQIVSEVALDLITIPVVSALGTVGLAHGVHRGTKGALTDRKPGHTCKILSILVNTKYLHDLVSF